MYKITPEGMRVARWTVDSHRSLSGPPSTYSLSAVSSEDGEVGTPKISQKPGHITRKSSTTDPMRKDYLSVSMDKMQLKDSYTTKLRQILEEPNLRSAFRGVLAFQLLRGEFELLAGRAGLQKAFQYDELRDGCPGYAEGRGQTHSRTCGNAASSAGFDRDGVRDI